VDCGLRRLFSCGLHRLHPFTPSEEE
jgi:hypothetical protein